MMAHAVLLLLALLLLVPVLLADSTHRDGLNYDAYCESMLLHAGKAARFYNVGNIKRAAEHEKHVESAFLAAVAIDAAEPQAFFTFANFLHNAQRFEESIHMWTLAVERTDGHNRQLVAERLQSSKYGLYSLKRDAAYANGQGNISDALRFARQQLEVYPQHPEVLFSIGTLETIMETDVPHRDPIKAFTRSQEVSLQSWVEGKRRLGYNCSRGVIVRTDSWLEHPKVESLLVHKNHPPVGRANQQQCDRHQFEDAGFFVARIREAQLQGGEALISLLNKKEAGDCTLFLPSAGVFVNIPKNVQLVETWVNKTNPSDGMIMHDWYDYSQGKLPHHGVSHNVMRFENAALITGYAASKYYHFVFECLPKLTILVEEYSTNLPDNTQFLFPRDASRNRFMDQYLELLSFSDRYYHALKKRIVWYDHEGPNDVRYLVNNLFVVDWPGVIVVDQDSNLRTEMHCVPPASAITVMRRSIEKALNIDFNSAGKDSRKIVLWVGRKREATRRFKNEGAFVTRLNHSVASAGGLLLEFDALHTTIQETVHLFASVAVVVGVHGGALSNIAFCNSHASVVELGFQSLQTRHFESAAHAIGLKYTHVPLKPDERGVAAQHVGFSSAEDQTVAINSVINALSEAMMCN